MEKSSDIRESLLSKQRPPVMNESVIGPRFKIFCGFIKLNRGIQRHHYFAMLVHSFVFGFFLSGTELLQQNILTDPSYYNYETGDAEEINSDIAMIDLLTKLIVTPVYGAMIDKLGRRKMAFIGYTLLTIAYLLFPIHHYSPAYFSSVAWYFGVRFIYSNGSAIIPLLPFVADYIEDSFKGRAIGINVLLMSSGFLTSTIIIGEMEGYDIFYTYMIFTAVIGIGGYSYSLFLKPGNQYYLINRITNKQPDAGQEQTKPKLGHMIANACKSKPWIIGAYIFAFLNGGSLAISGQILNLYIQSFNVPNGRSLGNSIVKLCNLATVCTAFAFGIVLDFISPLWIASVAFFCGSFGYLSIFGLVTVEGWIIKVVAIMTGITYSSSQLLANYLGFKFFPKPLRGLLFAVTNLFVIFAIILVSGVGGNLFKYVGPNWPFYLTAGLTVCSLFAFVFVYFKYILPWEKKQAKHARLKHSLLSDFSRKSPVSPTLMKPGSDVSIDAQESYKGKRVDLTKPSMVSSSKDSFGKSSIEDNRSRRSSLDAKEAQQPQQVQPFIPLL